VSILTIRFEYYDDYDPESFKDLMDWIELIKQTETKTGRVVPRILVGNKTDLTDMIAVDTSTAEVIVLSNSFFLLSYP
jgi:GTPase SAR1 family protein